MSVGVTEGKAGRAATEPDRLLSIGTFARRSRLSMKALRIYDRVVPRPVIDHRPFDRKFARVAVDNDENELPTGHHKCAPKGAL